jgi:hypothetical protein
LTPDRAWNLMIDVIEFLSTVNLYYVLFNGIRQIFNSVQFACTDRSRSNSKSFSLLCTDYGRLVLVPAAVPSQSSQSGSLRDALTEQNKMHGTLDPTLASCAAAVQQQIEMR